MIDSLGSYAAVLFDFDGTLADSYAAIASSVNHVRAQHGMPPLTIDEVKHFVGRGADYLLAATVPGGKLDDDLACYKAHHPTIMMPLTRWLPGALDLVAGLHRRGIKLGLCSNKPRAFSQALLEHLQVAGYFAVVLGPEDVPLPKPAPEMLLAAIDRLGLPKEQVLYVGDMVVDITTARAAGVRIWAVATGSEERRDLEAAQPDRLLTSLEEMLAEVGPL